MKKFNLYLLVMLLVQISYAQDGFPFIPLETVSNGSPVTLNLNDVADSAGLIPDVYLTLRLGTDWQAVSGSPTSDEASVEVITTAGSVTLSPATITSELSSGLTRLTFLITLPANYLPQNDGYLDVILRQTGTGTTADWNSIFIEVLPCLSPVASLTVVEDCGNDQYFIDVNITDIGSFGQCEIYDADFTYYEFVTTPGIYTIGPYFSDVFGQDITVAGHTSSGCINIYENVGLDCSTLSVSSNERPVITYSPNPVKQTFNINSTNQINKVQIFNLLGQNVLTKDVDENQLKIDMSNFQSGVYIVQINTISGRESFKILRE